MINYNKNKEIFFLGLVIAINILNVGIFWNTKYLCFFIALLLWISLLCQDYSKYNVDKKYLLIASLVCFFGGPIVENIMIVLSNNKCWLYGNPIKPLKVSLDLFPGYGIMAITNIIIYNYYLSTKII